MSAPLNQSPEHWLWTDESSRAYDWAIERLTARGMKGCHVLDVGSGSGTGVLRLQMAGFGAYGIDSNADAVNEALKNRATVRLAHFGGREDVRARNKWDAITMFGIIGYYASRDRHLIEDAMRLAPVVLMSTIRQESEFAWMKPLPVYDGTQAPALVEWSR